MVGEPYDVAAQQPNAGIWNSTPPNGTMTGTTFVNGTIIAVRTSDFAGDSQPPLLPPAVNAPWLLARLRPLVLGRSQPHRGFGDTLGGSSTPSRRARAERGQGSDRGMTDSKGGAVTASAAAARRSRAATAPHGGAAPAQEADGLTSGIARSMSGTPGRSVAQCAQTVLIAGF